MTSGDPPRLLDPLFSSSKIRAIFSDRGRLQGMLDFEAALARAEGRVGVIPSSVVAAIEAKCKAELFDIQPLARATALAGNPAIPLVKSLTSLVARQDAEAARFVHWGATSQDAMDTGLVLQARAAVELLDADLTRLSGSLARLTETHRSTTLAGRTWLQQAVPVTFGLKTAGWLSAIERHRVRMGELRVRLCVVQFGGASGTLASLGEHGIAVAAALADELRLDLPDVPWHTHRDRIVELATTLGLIVGTLGKIARDIALLMQTEIGEASEPSAPGKGGSSTMPHKRNPVSCAAVLATAVRVPGLVSIMLSAMVQEHERGLGGWHAEWETLPEICALTSGALDNIIRVVEGLDIHADRMRDNINVTRGLLLAEALSMALAVHVGKSKAHEMVEMACRQAIEQGVHLRDVLARDAHVMKYFSNADLDRLLDPRHYLGSAQVMVDSALSARKV